VSAHGLDGHAGHGSFCWMTAQADRVEHAVIDDEQVAGMKAGQGWFAPLCGEPFLVAFMDVGPVVRCRRCRQLIQARDSLRDFDQRLTEYRRPGWLDRLLCRYQQPAHPVSDTTPSRVHVSMSASAAGRRRPCPQDPGIFPRSTPAGAHRRHLPGRHAE
jgi:hypothetical protein